MIDRWLTTPQDELIPLMKHMFDYTIHTILFAVYDFNCEDLQLVTSVHDSYSVVSCILVLIGLSFHCKPMASITVHFNRMFQVT